jgi:hypothetical protein
LAPAFVRDRLLTGSLVLECPCHCALNFLEA